MSWSCQRCVTPTWGLFRRQCAWEENTPSHGGPPVPQAPPCPMWMGIAPRVSHENHHSGRIRVQVSCSLHSTLTKADSRSPFAAGPFKTPRADTRVHATQDSPCFSSSSNSTACTCAGKEGGKKGDSGLLNPQNHASTDLIKGMTKLKTLGN